MSWLALLVTAAVSFLLGSIPFGVIVGRFVFGTDIRTVGSGNIGTTNAIRAVGFKGGAAVFLLDFGKGIASGFVARACGALLPDAGVVESAFPALPDLLAVAFLFCTAGHIFSPWLGFKGGKGIAVAVGCMFVSFGPLWALAEIAVFAVLVALTRYVSVGSIAAALLCIPISIYVFWGHPFAVALACLAALLVFAAHRSNIGRLVSGTESRIGQARTQKEDA